MSGIIQEEPRSYEFSRILAAYPVKTFRVILLPPARGAGAKVADAQLPASVACPRIYSRARLRALFLLVPKTRARARSVRDRLEDALAHQVLQLYCWHSSRAWPPAMCASVMDLSAILRTVLRREPLPM
jgi:hypothetical protein